MNTDFDVIVIGAGPAGYTAAERAGARGRRVLLIEKDQPGGLCLNAGCIPSKTLLFSAKLYAQMQQGARYGVHAADLRFQLAEVIARKERLVQQLRDGVLYLMHRRSVTVVSGEAELLDRQTVRVQSTDYRAPALILAAGSSHVRPDIPGIDLPHVLNTTQMLDMTTMPTGLVILGSDGIGMGFATSFGLAGVPVTVIEAGPEILPALDAELAALLRKEMPYVTFITAAQVERITPAALHYHQNGHSHSLPADTVLISQGRRPALSLPGLDRLDLDYTPAGIRVNDHMQTNVPGVYAIGDITGRSMWAHAAIRMAEVAVHHLAGIPDRLRDHAIPLPVYSVPEIASVGLTEEQARARGHAVQVARLPMNANGRFLIESEGRRGLCKAVVDAHSQVLLGLHMIGTGCADMIFGAAAMIEDEFRVPEIQQLLFAHPTLSEIIKDTLYELR